MIKFIVIQWTDVPKVMGRAPSPRPASVRLVVSPTCEITQCSESRELYSLSDILSQTTVEQKYAKQNRQKQSAKGRHHNCQRKKLWDLFDATFPKHKNSRSTQPTRLGRVSEKTLSKRWEDVIDHWPKFGAVIIMQQDTQLWCKTQTDIQKLIL